MLLSDDVFGCIVSIMENDYNFKNHTITY